MSQLIASATDNLQIWEFINQEECKSLSKCSFTGTPTSISWNHTNQVVAVGLSDKKIDLVQATTGQLLSTLPFTTYDDILDQVRAVKFSGNSRYLASAEGKAVQLWDLKKRSLKTKLEGHNAPIVAISFFADGTIAAGDRGGAIRIWDVKSDSSFQEMSVDQVSADRIAAADNYSLTCMELSLSGPSRVAAGYSDGSLSLWDPVTLCQLRKQNVHRLDISSIAFSPKNPRLIATSSFDGRMTLVDTGRNLFNQIHLLFAPVVLNLSLPLLWSRLEIGGCKRINRYWRQINEVQEQNDQIISVFIILQAFTFCGCIFIFQY